MFDDEKPIIPLDATKKSSTLIKNVWGEGLTVKSGIVALSGLSLILLMVLWTVSIILGIVLLGGSLPFIVISSAVAAILYIILIAFVGALNTVVTTALYMYATTGEVPYHFTAELLKGTIRPKKGSVKQ